MIKLVACDLDGTLLDPLMNLTSFSVDVIKKCVAHGIIFLMATGRDYYMVIEYKEQNDLHCDMILNNGSQYLSDDLKTNIYYPIDHTMLSQVVNILQKYDYHISMHTTNGKYIFEDPDQYYQEHINMIIEDRGFDILSKTNAAFFRKDGFLRATHSIHSIEEMFEQGVEALKLDCKNRDSNKGKAAMEELKKIDHILLSSSYERYVEITSDRSHKGKLLEMVCKQYGISKEEVAVFGDGVNDLAMLSLFPNSYAPGNANEKVKAVVKEVIRPNSEDGVAYKLLEILEERENGN